MENKKFDINSIMGFVFMGLILLWMFYSQSKQTKADQLKKALELKKQDSIQKANPTTKVIDSLKVQTAALVPQTTDSVQNLALQTKLGAFAYSASIPSAKENKTVLENDLLKIIINNKGAKIEEIQLKKYQTYDKKPLYLVKDDNAQLEINFNTKDNRVLNTKDLYFEPVLVQKDGFQTLSMRLKVSETQYLEYVYILKPADYMLDFNIQSVGLEQVLDASKPVKLTWDLKTIHTEKSLNYEGINTALVYRFDDNEFNEVLGAAKPKIKDVSNVNWVAYRQQFFTSILAAKQPIKGMVAKAENLVKDEEIDTVHTKRFTTEIPLTIEKGNLKNEWNFYFGPADYNKLKVFPEMQLERSVNMGWGLFRWINKYLFIPIFDLLKGSIASFGLIIILLTLVVKLIMSPLVFKSYLASAKMKVLRPEMEEINAKYPGKENAMKRQQEVMAVQSKAGVSMLSGCIPALLQMPVFFALFRFFPANFDLRQKSFLWADDLSAYDSIYELPFKIPIYGSHISLFPLLASIAIFFYMQMTQSQQANMQPPAQEGMPDMQKMMKVMLWVSPVMMLFFFNQYGSGLSLYYFVSNLLTIAIMWVIKEYVVDEAKVHAMVQKKKAEEPKKKSAFRQRLDDAMKQAQEQQEKQKKIKK
ncbi:MAG: membrane protein insertase YidC [Flavobacteriaceae bacterium]|nr:membrane protein insertase YidC [Flavobacteriaceae bacterium]